MIWYNMIYINDNNDHGNNNDVDGNSKLFY